MKNIYGAQLDSNGYAPSIMQVQPDRECFRCGSTINLVRHEPICGVKLKRKSAALGLWVTLCAGCHRKVHASGSMQMTYRQYAERCALFYYDWNIDKFIEEFGKNYI